DPDSVPVREDAPLRVTNPYGRTKLVMEQLIGDLCASDPGFHAVNLRYFNPVGAHASGLIGEAPGGVPNNLMPYVCQVAVRQRERLAVFGGDWPTVDGTGVRDYIHVVDLARAHADALEFLLREARSANINLGTGRGTSVLELVRAFEDASGHAVPFDIVPRRPGDVAEVYADPSLAHELLGWPAEHGIEAMCRAPAASWPRARAISSRRSGRRPRRGRHGRTPPAPTLTAASSTAGSRATTPARASRVRTGRRGCPPAPRPSPVPGRRARAPHSG